MKDQTPKPPAHLRPATRDWWKQTLRDYVLPPHKLRVLQAACECWDRLCQATETVNKEGLTVEGREGGTRAHPAVAVERDCRIAFARLVRELGLDEADEEANKRGPGRPAHGLGISYTQLGDLGHGRKALWE